MNIHQYILNPILITTALTTVSCVNEPVTPEFADTTEVPVLTSGDASDTPVASDGETPHRFQFDIALVNEGARALRSQVQAQADRWARVLQGSDLEDIEWEPGTVRCGGLEYDYRKDVLDDLLLLVATVDLDNGPGAGSTLTYCGYRESSKLPMIGALKLDIDRVPEGDVNELILHGLGHLLGISIYSWETLGLLRNPAHHTPGADAHFVGPRAIAAFVSAGGASYQGARVPVENDPTYGTVDSHWRESVFGNELMTTRLAAGTDYLSAVTIQALADMGYTVNLEEADRYVVGAASNASASAEKDRHAIDLSGDVVASPAVFYDRHGRVTRVVRPN